MKRILLFILFTAQLAFSQILTYTPLFPTVDDTISIIYDATQGNGALVGATEVYAHTGVLLTSSTSPSNWKYVKCDWGENSEETKLEPLGEDKWFIKFHIKTYYNIAPSETVTHLAFVFRDASCSNEGKTETYGDIFVPIYRKGFNIALLSPTQTETFLDLDDTLKITAAGTSVQSITLFRNDSQIASTESDTLNFIYIASNYGRTDFSIVGQDSTGNEKRISFAIIVNEPITVEELPTGMQDGINYISDSQVLLSLNAPHKEFAYVIGDFTNWEIDPAFYMKKTPDGGGYWILLENLKTNQEYIFQYLVDGKIKIADPYTEKISDPWHDKYITDATYPGLIPYPEDKTTEIASVLEIGQEAYDWQIDNFQRPTPGNLVIYECLLRDFLVEHDWKTLTDTLSYFKRLGINAIELMPWSEFEGNESWGYNPSFYFATDKYYGPKEDLKAFIDAAHAEGIAVIQDIVLNHSYGQSPLVRLYLEDMEQNPWYNVTSPNPVFSWGFDFDHESQATKDFVDRVTSFWLTEYKVDGFRFDFTKGFTNKPGDGSGRDNSRIALLKRMADKIWEVDPTAYVILEHFADNSEEKELANYGMLIWGNSNYNYNEATMGYNENRKSDFSWISYLNRGWDDPHVVGYMESHDEERLMFKNLEYGNSNSSGTYNIKELDTALDRVKMAAAFFFTVPGPKMLWQFGELGYDFSIDYNGRIGNKPIRWDYYDDNERRILFNVFSSLIKLKTDYPAFSSNDFDVFAYPPVKRININHETMNVTIIGNFDVKRSSISAEFQHTGKWYDYFSGDSINVTDTQKTISLKAGEFHIYTNKKLDTPDLTTKVEHKEIKSLNSFDLLQNYPNPFNPTTTIKYEIPVDSMVRIDIFDIQGRKLKSLTNSFQAAGQHSQNWDGRDELGITVASGIYLYKIAAGEFVQTRKMTLLR